MVRLLTVLLKTISISPSGNIFQRGVMSAIGLTLLLGSNEITNDKKDSEKEAEKVEFWKITGPRLWKYLSIVLKISMKDSAHLGK